MVNFIKLCLVMVFPLLLGACSKDNPENPAAETAENVEGMYFITRFGYSPWSGSYSYFEPFLLLKDGSIRKRLERPYEILNVAESKQTDAGHWGTWKKNGQTIEIVWPDGKTETWESWHVGFPATADEKLNRDYNSLYALTTGGLGEVFSFRSDGTFTVTRRRNFGSVKLNGTYQLKGYGAYFTFDDGTKESWSFVFMHKNGQKNTDGFLMGGDNYSSKD